MRESLLRRAMDAQPQDPVEYVRRNYEALKERYGGQVVAVHGLPVKEGGGKVVASAETFVGVEVLVSEYCHEHTTTVSGYEVLIGTLDGIRRGECIQVFRFAYWEDTLEKAIV